MQEIFTEITDHTDTQTANKANKTGDTLINAILTGATITGTVNSSYARKADGNGAGVCGNGLLLLFAIDIGTPANYIFAIGYKGNGLVPTFRTIQASVLAINTANAGGTQIIAGGTYSSIIQYVITIPM